MKKIKVLALTLVFAFAALGGAYAMWFDTLYVDATAKTGIVDLAWDEDSLHLVDADPNYEGLDGDVYGVDDDNDGLDTLDPGNVDNDQKNIGSLTAVIKKSAKSADGGDQDKVSRLDKLQVVLKNGYPAYQEYIDVNIKNVGTVPVKFEEPLPEGVPEWLLVEFRNPSDQNETLDLTGYQLDPGEEIPVMIVCRVLGAEDGEGKIVCPQNATAKFTITLKGVQWNGYEFPLKDEIQFPRDDEDYNP